MEGISDVANHEFTECTSTTRQSSTPVAISIISRSTHYSYCTTTDQFAPQLDRTARPCSCTFNVSSCHSSF